MAIGGKALCPEKPIRYGEVSAYVQAEVGPYLVLRTFMIDPDSKSGAWTTKLKITAKEAGQKKLNQTSLNEIVSPLTFDPLALSNQKEKEIIDKLKTMAGPEFMASLDRVDEEEAAAYEERSHVTRQIKEMGEPSEPEKTDRVDTQGLMAELKEIEQFNRAQDLADRTIKKATADIATLKTTVQELKDKLERAEAALKIAVGALDGLTRPQELKDPAPIEERLSNAAEINSKADAYDRYLGQVEKLDKLKDKKTELTNNVNALRQERLDLFANAKLPVPGLAFGDDGLTLNGIPVKQLSKAQAWKMWVRIGIETLPKPQDGKEALRIMLIQDGSLLDNKSFEILRAMAAEHNCKMWMETVGAGHGEDAIIIDEGEVVSLEEWKARQEGGAS